MRARRTVILRWVVGLAVGVAVGSVAVSAAGGLSESGQALSRVDARWVAAAVGSELIVYVLVASHLRRLTTATAAVSRWLSLRLALVISGFGLLTPAAPAEGLTIAGRELRKRGFGQREAVLTLGFTQWFETRVFLLVAGLNVLLAVALGDLPAAEFIPILVAAVVAVLGLIATARLASRTSTGERLGVALDRLRFWRPRSSAVEQRAAGAKWHAHAMSIVGSPRNRVTLVAMSVGALLANAGCLWASLAASGVHEPRADIVLLAATAATAAAWVPFIPAGLGLAEAVIPAVLHHFGAPTDAALAGALVYRIVGTLLPAAAGAVIVLTLVARRGRN